MAFVSYVEINVVKFRAIGDVTTTTVEMKLPKGTVVGPPDSGVYSDGVVTLVGSYYIKVKRKEHSTPADPNLDDTVEMQVKFWVAPPAKKDDPRYLLQGVAFSNRDQDKGDPDNRLGQVDFPKIQIDEEKVPGLNDEVRVFTVTNNRKAKGKPENPDKPDGKKKKVSYDYLFLIQETEHGRIGIIDPEWENEPI